MLIEEEQENTFIEEGPRKALLFGIDGMIDNINRVNYTIWKNVLSEYGYELTFKEYLQIFLFESASNVLIQLLPYSTVDEHDEIVKKKERNFVEYIKMNDISVLSVSCIEGLYEFLSAIVEKQKEDVKKGDKPTYLLGVVSDLSNAEIKSVLTKLNLMLYFDVIFSSHGIKRLKPDPSIYLIAKENLKLDSKNIFVFEATVEGCSSALRALGEEGNVIGIKRSFGDECLDEKEMFECGVKTIVNSFKDFNIDLIEMM
ncbi:hypothetical protein ABK040_007893 [Willaertia magna]